MSWQPPQPPPPGPPPPPGGGQRRPPPPAAPAAAPPAPSAPAAASPHHHRIEEWESWDAKHRNEAVLHQPPHRVPPSHHAASGTTAAAGETLRATPNPTPPPAPPFPPASVAPPPPPPRGDAAGGGRGAAGAPPANVAPPPPSPSVGTPSAPALPPPSPPLPGTASAPFSVAPRRPPAPVGPTTPGRVAVVAPPAAPATPRPPTTRESSPPLPFDDVPLDDGVPPAVAAPAPTPPPRRRQPPAAPAPAAPPHRIEEWESWDSKHRNPAVLHRPPHGTPRVGGVTGGALAGRPSPFPSSSVARPPSAAPMTAVPSPTPTLPPQPPSTPAAAARGIATTTTTTTAPESAAPRASAVVVPAAAPAAHRPKVQEWESWDRRHRNPALLAEERRATPLAGGGGGSRGVPREALPRSAPPPGPAVADRWRPPVPPPRPPPSTLPTPTTRNEPISPPRHRPKVQEWESWDKRHVNPALVDGVPPTTPPVLPHPPPPAPPSLPHPGPVAASTAPPPPPGPPSAGSARPTPSSAPGLAAAGTTSRGGGWSAAAPTPPPPPSVPPPREIGPTSAPRPQPPAPAPAPGGVQPRQPPPMPMPMPRPPDLPTPQRRPPPSPSPAGPTQPSQPQPQPQPTPPSRKLPSEWGQPLHRKERIDPSQIPRPPLFTRPHDAAAIVYSPRSAMETDRCPPPADSRYVVCDDGNANPRSMRFTTFRVPKDDGTRRKTGIDMGLICTPMCVGSEDFVHRPLPEEGCDDDSDADCDCDDDDSSDLGPLEPEVESVPVVSTSDGDVVNPIRCEKCMAYLNPFVRLDRSMTSFGCNFCGATSSIPALNPSDPNLDLIDLPAKFGSVEYEVGGSYDVRKRRVEPVHLYALECGDDPVKLVAHLDGVERVGRELGRQWKRQEGLRLRRLNESGRGGGGGGVGRPLSRPRIGLFFFRRNLIYFPYFKERRRSSSSSSFEGPKEEEDDEDLELCACVVPDVTTDPFSPLPLGSWTYDVSTEAGKGRWRELFERLPNFIGSVIMTTTTTSSSGGPPPPHPAAGTRKSLGGGGGGVGGGSGLPPDGGTRLSCGGAALAVLADALRDGGGRGTLLTSTRPNFGIGFLRDREGGNLSLYTRSSSEKSLYSPLQRHVPQGELFFANKVDEKAGAYYKALGEECAKNGVRVDVVITTPSSSSTDERGRKTYLDLATLGELCRITCGKIKWLHCSEGGTTGDLAVDGSYGKQVREELLRSATSFAGADAVFKVRCSAGLQIKSYFPSVSPGVTIDGALLDSPELELASVGPDDCLAVLLEHRVGGVPNTRHLWPPDGVGGGESSCPMAYFQSALLYTSSTGRRRVRVTTLGLRTATSVPDVFRSADFGAIAALMARRAVSDLVDPRDGHPFRARDGAVQRCVEVLANYRTNTSAKKSPPGQLILPETLQLLPLFCTSLRKNAALRQSLGKNAAGVRSGRPYPDADERAYHLFYGGTVSPALTMLFVHPNVFCLSGLREDDGEWFAPASSDVGSAARGGGGGGAAAAAAAAAPFRQRSARDAKVVDASVRPYVRLPRTTHPSVSCLDDDGIYLIDDGFAIHLLVGKSVRPDVVDDLLDFSEGLPSGDLATAEGAGAGAPDGGAVVASISRSSDSGKKVRRMIRQLRTYCATSNGGSAPVRPTHAPVVVVALAGGAGRGADVGGPGARRGGSSNRRPEEEERIVNLLVDDSTTDERGYVDFLCALHRKIREHMDRQMSSS